jgi:hypothetical protein
MPGAHANDKPDGFYGDWTVDFEKDGKTVGIAKGISRSKANKYQTRREPGTPTPGSLT